MRSPSTLALAAVLLASVAVTAPASAQKPAAAAPAAAPARKFNFSKEAVKPLQVLQKAVEGNDDAGYPAALAAAQAAAKNGDDKYVIGQFQLRHSINHKDNAETLVALQAMIDSGSATPQELPTLYQNVGALQYQAKNFEVANAAFRKNVELAPNDTDAILRLAQVEADGNRPTEAVPLLEKAIAVQTAAGQPAPENWYKLALKYAYQSKMPGETVKISKQLITAYPNPTNWRDGLVLYRDAANLDKGTNLDLMRLMRAAKALNGERDWFELADTANDSGLPGETKSVLDEGIAARQVDPAKQTFKDLITVSNSRIAADKAALPGLEKQAAAAAQGRIASNTADAYLGYGQYDKAAELYRTALQKGSVDANVVNTRLGIALALGGHKAEAETAFKSVSGPRTDLASFWLLWLGQRA